jgi:KUP system potassium uptake protein
METGTPTAQKSTQWKLALAALGIVFGDIGTSPLYAFRECFSGKHGAPIIAENMMGAASLIVWSILFVVTFKYVFLVLRLDNKGEGGILALAALVRGSRTAMGKIEKPWVFGLGLLGAALIYADGMITPSISVLSAVEGLNVLSPDMKEYIVPAALVIIVLLFMIQRHGTGKVGALFGPILLIWFSTLGILGLKWIIAYPQILLAINPLSGLMFLIHEWRHAIPLLSAVFLAVTGGEALYTDLGHFGRKPIRVAWFSVVLPCLVLNYIGQAALLTLHPDTENTFYNLVPPGGVLPLTLLATAAAVIASQALISGAFSLTTQAIQLGCIPRLRVLYTSSTEKGQVYLPMINWMLMIACLLLISIKQSSSNLFPAYGIAISMTMTVTSVLFLQAALTVLKWPRWKAYTVSGAFLLVDGAFLFANGLKITQGGWMPLAVAFLLVFLMSTWRWGRARLSKRMEKASLPAELLIEDLQRKDIHRVSGTAFYMCGKTGGIPLALLHNLKHNQVLHTRVVLLHVETLDASHAMPEDRFEMTELGQGFHLLHLRFGFTETPNVPVALKEFLTGEFKYEPNKSTFFLGRETYAVSRDLNAWARFRLVIFAWLTRNATPATAYFSLPPSRVVELGAQISL